MKLFTRYSRINIFVIIIIFIIASTALFFSIRYILLHQVDDDLRIEEKEIATYVDKYNRLPESISVKDQIIDIQAATAPTVRHFTTNRFIEPGDATPETFRQLVFGIRAGNNWYRITVSKSLEDSDALVHSILIISLITILTILVASFAINRFVLKRIWRPFYQSLDAVRQFKIGSGEELQLPPSSFEEFSFMNDTLLRLTQQAQLDYLSLKTFSENAAHEIQTPIAIIRSKLDLLIQDENLSEEQSQAAQSAYNAIQKLARLNHSLLLLAKIENRQYDEVEQVDLEARLREKLNDFQELWQAQQISVQPLLQPARISMNPELADILLNNLLSNATRHNYTGGYISIILNEKVLEISNTSHEGALDDRALFQRFYKPSQNAQHNGLGLSIIRQICDSSGFPIQYRFEEERHFFRVSFEEQN
jgi:signal transduction histidine kinase